MELEMNSLKLLKTVSDHYFNHHIAKHCDLLKSSQILIDMISSIINLLFPKWSINI